MILDHYEKSQRKKVKRERSDQCEYWYVDWPKQHDVNKHTDLEKKSLSYNFQGVAQMVSIWAVVKVPCAEKISAAYFVLLTSQDILYTQFVEWMSDPVTGSVALGSFARFNF